MDAQAIEAVDAGCVGDEHRIGDPTEAAIENVVAAVGDERGWKPSDSRLVTARL